MADAKEKKVDVSAMSSFLPHQPKQTNVAMPAKKPQQMLNGIGVWFLIIAFSLIF